MKLHPSRLLLSMAAAACALSSSAAPLSSFLDRGYAIATDSAARGFRVFQATQDGTAAVVYEWLCAQDAGFTGGVNDFIYTSDVKIRDGGRTALLVGATDWAVVDVSGDAPRCIRSGHANDGGHGIDLLPDGTVVKGDSNSATSGSLWLMPADGTAKPAFSLPSCHGVEWDEARQCVWALGYTNLVKLSYDRASKTLSELQCWTIPGNSGHCLDLAEDGRLYLTEWRGIHRFDPETETFTTLYTLSNPKGISHSETHGDLVELPTSDQTDGYSATKLRVYPVSGDASTYYEVTPSPTTKMYRGRWLSAFPAPRAPILGTPAASVADAGSPSGADATLSVPLVAPGTTAASVSLSLDGAVVRSWSDLAAATALSETVAAAPGSTHSFAFTATDADGDTATASGLFSVPERIPPALGAALAVVAEDGTSAALSATLVSADAWPVTLTLRVGDAVVRTWDASAPGSYSETVPTTPGESCSFAFEAADTRGVTSVARGFFVAKTVDGWFDVRLEDPGYVPGAAWTDTSAVTSDNGRWTASDGRAVLVQATSGAPRRVELGATAGLAYAPEEPSGQDAESVTVSGRLRLSASSRPPAIPGNGEFAGLAFVVADDAIRPFGYAADGWRALSAPGMALVMDDWLDYAIDLDFSDASAPQVRYRLGGVVLLDGDAAWLPLAPTVREVSEIVFLGGGAIGDFRGVRGGAESPGIVLTEEDAPVLGGATPLGFGVSSSGSATFCMTVVNVVGGAYYTAFASESLDGPWLAEEDSAVGVAGEPLVLAIDASDPRKPARFARIVVSTTPYAAGDAYGSHRE